MNDKELADKVVALGVIYQDDAGAYWKYVNDRKNLSQGIANFPEELVRDWRAAGALMEMVGGIYLHNEQHIKGWWVYAETSIAVKMPADKATGKNESLPRAIIEACVDTLE